MSTILGIDLGKFKSVACVFSTQDGEIRFETLDTNPKAFHDLLTRIAPDMTLFETSTAAGWVYDLCQEREFSCQVVNPLGEAWQWKKVKRKTDRDDAHKLIRMYLLNELPTVHMTTPEVRQQRALVNFRQRLIGQRTSIQNRIRALFQAQGLTLPTGHQAWTAQALGEWAVFAKPIDQCSPNELWRGMLHADLALLASFESQLAQLEKHLNTVGKNNPQVQLLTTIPGVGVRTAEAIVAYLDDPRRFRNSREVSAYVGLVPRQFQSGTMDRKGGVTKRGPAQLRKLLVECAWLMRRHNPWGAEIVERISQGRKGRMKSAVVALARKLLVCCWAMLKKNEPWRSPQIAPAAA
jgi:transposase